MVALIEHKRAEIADAYRRFGVHRLELFGSATGDTFDPETSDLDFLVEFPSDRDLGPWLRDYFAMRDELQRTFDRSVDLVS